MAQIGWRQETGGQSAGAFEVSYVVLSTAERAPMAEGTSA